MWLIFWPSHKHQGFWIIESAFFLGTVPLSNRSLGKEPKAQKIRDACGEARLLCLGESNCYVLRLKRKAKKNNNIRSGWLKA